MIILHDGRKAGIVGAHLVFGNDDYVSLRDLQLTVSNHAFNDVASDEISGPVVYGLLKLPDGSTFRAGMTPRTYNQIVIAARSAQPNPAALAGYGRGGVRQTSAARQLGAAVGAIVENFRPCCGRR